MAEHEDHHDPIEDNIETHPLKVAIWVVIGAVALIIGIILLAQFAVGAHGARSLKGDPAMSPEAVAKRLAPVAQLAIDAKAPAGAPAGATAPVPATAVAAVTIPPPAGAAAAPAGGSGKATFESVCGVCHTAGVAGAPKFADKAAWAPRIKTGLDALHASALKGKGAMPPKGGNASLSDADVKAAVDYMVAAAK